LYKINKQQEFGTIPQLDCCYLHKCIHTVDAEIIIQTNFIHISIWNYILLSMTILCILVYIVAGEIKNLNKSNFCL
jgi:hypothetical protein